MSQIIDFPTDHRPRVRVEIGVDEFDSDEFCGFDALVSRPGEPDELVAWGFEFDEVWESAKSWATSHGASIVDRTEGLRP